MFNNNQKPHMKGIELVEKILTDAGVNPKDIAEIRINQAYRDNLISCQLATEAITALNFKEPKKRETFYITTDELEAKNIKCIYGNWGIIVTPSCYPWVYTSLETYCMDAPNDPAGTYQIIERNVPLEMLWAIAANMISRLDESQKDV